jgi:hypothetical protein
MTRLAKAQIELAANRLRKENLLKANCQRILESLKK